jgi:hypothetical protein
LIATENATDGVAGRRQTLPRARAEKTREESLSLSMNASIALLSELHVQYYCITAPTLSRRRV